MRKSRFCASHLALLVAATPFSGGFASFALADPGTGAVSSSVVQATPPQQTWEQHLQERLRRLRVKLGDPAANTPVPLKEAAIALRSNFDAYGLPAGLTAADLQEMSADAAELANCAELDPKPPADTEYALVVYLHDLGLSLQKAIDSY